MLKSVIFERLPGSETPQPRDSLHSPRSLHAISCSIGLKSGKFRSRIDLVRLFIREFPSFVAEVSFWDES